MFGYLPGEYEVIDLVLTLVCQQNARIIVVNTLSIGMKQIQISPPGPRHQDGALTQVIYFIMLNCFRNFLSLAFLEIAKTKFQQVKQKYLLQLPKKRLVTL